MTSQGQKARTLMNRDTKFFNLRDTAHSITVSLGKDACHNNFVFINLGDTEFLKMTVHLCQEANPSMDKMIHNYRSFI